MGIEKALGIFTKLCNFCSFTKNFNPEFLRILEKNFNQLGVYRCRTELDFILKIFTCLWNIIQYILEFFQNFLPFVFVRKKNILKLIFFFNSLFNYAFTYASITLRWTSPFKLTRYGHWGSRGPQAYTFFKTLYGTYFYLKV